MVKLIFFKKSYSLRILSRSFLRYRVIKAFESRDSLKIIETVDKINYRNNLSR
jgi:hypothetical protein